MTENEKFDEIEKLKERLEETHLRESEYKRRAEEAEKTIKMLNSRLNLCEDKNNMLLAHIIRTSQNIDKLLDLAFDR